MLRVGIGVESFRCAGILLLQWQGENLAHRQPLKFYHVQPVNYASKNPISPKVFNRFSKSLPQLENADDGHLGGTFQLRRHFTFEMAKWKLCAATISEILLLSSCTLCQQKSNISKDIQLNFWNLPLSSKILTVAIWVKSFRCARVLLLQWLGENFAHQQHFKFCHCSTCTLRKQKSYISKGIQPIFEIFAVISKMLRVAIWVESFRFACILLLQWQGENFTHREYLKLCYFQPVPCASKNPISPKVFNRFLKSWPQLEYVDGGHLVEKFQVRTYFTSAMARWTFVHRTLLKFCYFQPVHCASKNHISPKFFNRFSKSSQKFDDVEGGHLSGKFQVRGCFTFAMGNWKLCASTTFEILQLSTCTLFKEKSYISKDIQPIFEIVAQSSKMLTMAIWVESFGWAGILLLQWEGENFAHRQHLKFFHFQPIPCASRNPISPKIFNRFSKSFASARRCWGWSFGWKVSGAQVFYFCNSKVKTLRIDNIWNFATFSLYTVPAKILYHQRYSTNFRNLGLSSKMLRVGICVGKFQLRSCILLLKWLTENFAHGQQSEILLLSTCTLCQQKSNISKDIQANFRNLRVSSKMLEGGHLGGKFQLRRHFTFEMANESFRIDNIWNFRQWQGQSLCIEHFWNFATFNLYTVPA